MSLRTNRLHLIAILLLCVQPSWAQIPLNRHEQAPDLERIDREAEAAYHKNFEAMRKYSFRRHLVRQALDKHGNVKSKEVIVSRVTPEAVGFNERLLEINGRAPTAREIRKHRKARTFERHFKDLAEGRLSMSVLGDLRLALLMETYDYTYEGIEEVEGTRCYRFSVKPFDPPKGADLTVQVASASEGNFWVSVEGSNLVKMRSRSVRPLKKFGMGLNALELASELKPHRGAWLFSRFEVKSEYTVLGTFRKHYIWTYSDYRGQED